MLQNEGYGPVIVKRLKSFTPAENLPVSPAAPATPHSPETTSSPPRPSASVESGADDKAPGMYSISALIDREGQVLEGVSQIGTGIKDRAAEASDHLALTAFELGTGALIGSALVLASRNPALGTTMRILNRSMLGIAGIDLTSRFAIPSFDALMHPENIDKDKTDLGSRLGAAVVDYSMAAFAGGIGSRSITPLIERSAIGSKISGYDFFKMPSGAELRVFKSGNALISRKGVRVFRDASGSDMDFDQLDPTAEPRRGIVGNNDLLQQTFDEAKNHLHKWREGKEIVESASNFGSWFESLTGALASEVVERSVDVGIGLIEHDYLVKTIDGSGEPDTEISRAKKPEK
jgi:hypothetical protein